MKFFQTFRGRLVVVLAFLLMATLGVQYYLNLRAEEENSEVREMQEQALVSGITLGVNGMVGSERMKDLIEHSEVYLNSQTKERIKDIIIINNKFEIEDSLNPNYLPAEDAEGNAINRKIAEIQDLPPLMNANRLGEERLKFPNARALTEEEREALEEKNDGEAHLVSLKTNQGRWYVMIILKTNRAAKVQRAARTLIYTLAILTISSLITILLVWRFTRPIANLSEVARKIAAGDLSVRVPDDGRTDEMGKLASRFNEMTVQLEKKSELEAQLKEAEKSAVVGRLGSAIAHEIRNPLNYINLTLDHLRAKFIPEDDEKRQTFEKLTMQLKSEVARINGQITAFLSYSRPLKLKLQPVKVRETIADSLRIVEGQAAQQGVSMALIEHEDVPQILADKEVLRSVFDNLLLNGIQAMKTGGNLKVKIEPFENFVKIEVADTGEGISGENLLKIFEPYFSTKETGTGLGLAIVKRIVEEHHGTIAVESKLEQGTTFTVKLPKA